ncbi:MAG: GyrI-like domain-containing protein [Acidimicrobiia bacterium]|nr:GyrI-like domain-containing protein [Acidimicrobiia bacterium]
MASIDLKRVYKEHYSARAGKPALVEVPPRSFLMIDGNGDPNTAQEYADAVAALYPLAYGLRAAVKKETGDGYTVMPLEGLWWADDMSRFSVERKGDWKWTMMICQPDLVTGAMADEVIPEVTRKKNLVAGHKVRLEVYDEGPAAQVMHIGPYAAEAPTIELLHDFIAARGLALSGLHHEIYLGDPRKSDPAKLKTIIRQPVAGR